VAIGMRYRTALHPEKLYAPLMCCNGNKKASDHIRGSAEIPVQFLNPMSGLPDVARKRIFLHTESGPKIKKPAIAKALAGEVGIPGFEPGTPWSQTRCATGLRYIPNNFLLIL